MFGVEKSLQSIQTTESEDTPWERLYGKGKKKHWSSQSWCHTHKFARFWRLSFGVVTRCFRSPLLSCFYQGVRRLLRAPKFSSSCFECNSEGRIYKNVEAFKWEAIITFGQSQVVMSRQICIRADKYSSNVFFEKLFYLINSRLG